MPTIRVILSSLVLLFALAWTPNAQAETIEYAYQGQKQYCLGLPCGFGTTIGQEVGRPLTGSFVFDLDVLPGGTTEDTNLGFKRIHEQIPHPDGPGDNFLNVEYWEFYVRRSDFDWAANTERAAPYAPTFDAAANSVGFGVAIFGGFREYVTPGFEGNFDIWFDESGNIIQWKGLCSCGGSYDPSTRGNLPEGTGADGRFGQKLGSTGPGSWTRSPEIAAVVPLPASYSFLLIALSAIGLMGSRRR